MGERCFFYSIYFSFIGLIDGLVWSHRSSSTPISRTWQCCILLCSFGCVWEWLNGWVDESDLPKLQSIQLGEYTFWGDWRGRNAIESAPYNFRNTFTMKRRVEWVDRGIELPALTRFKGHIDAFEYIGSVILESIHGMTDWSRYPSIVS